MKATILKMVLPVAAFVLASAGAVGTGNAKSTNAKSAVFNGWTIACVELRDCNNMSTNLCKQAGVQAYAKDGSNCIQALFHKP